MFNFDKMIVGLDLQEDIVPDTKSFHFKSEGIAGKIDSVANANKLERRVRVVFFGQRYDVKLFETAKLYFVPDR